MGLNRVAGWRLLFELLLLAFLASGASSSSFEVDFAKEPQIASQAPRRIVFTQRDLAACLSDVSATTCVLQGVPLRYSSSTDARVLLDAAPCSCMLSCL